MRFIRSHRKTVLVSSFFVILIAALSAWAQISVSRDPTGNLVRVDSLAIGEIFGNARIRAAYSGVVTLDPPAIPATSKALLAFAIPASVGGSTNDDIVVMGVPNYPGGLNDDLLYCGSYTSTQGTQASVSVCLYNPTAGPIDDGALVWSYLFLKVTP